MKFRSFPLALGALIASGCATTSTPAPSTAPAPADLSVEARYALAIADSSVVEEHEVIPLPAITEERINVVTWSAWPDSFPVGEEIGTGWGETWVTVDGHLKEACQGFEPETVTTDIQHLLGLPERTEDRFVVTLNVPSEALFRPCANPDITQTQCDNTLPAEISAEHAKWYLSQVAGAYQAPNGYPWTRLGYTYHWGVEGDEIGLMELVIKKGTKVQVLDVASPQDYCAP